jgi:hypothetical protein
MAMTVNGLSLFTAGIPHAATAAASGNRQRDGFPGSFP